MKGYHTIEMLFQQSDWKLLPKGHRQREVAHKEFTTLTPFFVWKYAIPKIIPFRVFPNLDRHLLCRLKTGIRSSQPML